MYVFLFAVLPTVAIALSFWAKSRFAKFVLLVGGGYFLLVFLLARLANWDCNFGNFEFQSCATLPEMIAFSISFAHFWNFLLGAPVAIVLLLLGGYFEHQVRSKPRWN